MTLAAWALFLLLLTWFASGYLERLNNPNVQVVSRVDPGGSPEVLLQQNRAGHYVATGAINDVPVVFLVDTGATDVAVSQKVAERIGLEKGFRVTVNTANGTAYGWNTILDKVTLGNIEMTAVPATIMPGLGQEALLGMSFLKRLTLIQRGEELLIRQE
ncbi:MAG: TIGR02281 family clan AA aspartic protease [Sedimenticolaceae bacterium]|nr:TIGR02281 family clan AA aspartic protease [Sedimenticolaceae bacterium]